MEEAAVSRRVVRSGVCVCVYGVIDDDGAGCEDLRVRGLAVA